MLFNGFSEVSITIERLPVFYKQVITLALTQDAADSSLELIACTRTLDIRCGEACASSLIRAHVWLAM